MGHDEPGQLTEALRRDPYAVLLFDEVEKAHREVTGALLALLDAGRLTDAHGRSVDATHAVVMLTSNLGAELILGAPGGDVEAVREPVLALARVVLRPELVNRVDEVVLFAPLSAQALAAITATVLEETRQRLAAQGVGLQVSDAAVDVAGRARRGRARAGSPAAAAHGGPRGGPDAVADAAGGRGRRRGRGPGGRRRTGAGWPSRSAAMAEAERDTEPDKEPDEPVPPVRPRRGRKLVTRTLVRAWDDNIFSEAAAAAFWQTLSLPPLLLGLFGILSYVGDLYGPDTITAVQNQVVELVGPVFSRQAVEDIIAPTSTTSSPRRAPRSSRSGS